MKYVFPLVLVALFGCSKQAVDLSGLACADGDCITGYACHPETGLCVPEIAIGCDGEALCPSEVAAGTPCLSEGSFIPCVDGASDCTEGCRTCVDGVWSDTCAQPCVPDGAEVCDGRDNDCNDAIDDLTQAEVDSACADASAHAASWACTAGACQVATCDDGFWNVETSDDDCEYPCALTAGGAEICDGLDNDCDGTADNVVDVDADCDTQLGDPADVAHFSCVCGGNGCCVISQCEPGFVDEDGQANNGCEMVCNPSTPGPEICDGEDNDCDGTADNPLVPGVQDCVTYFRDHDLDGHGADGDSECWCAATGEYIVTTEDDCNDDDGAIFDGATEVCDGKDNDCDPGTDDGSEEATFGDDCDGADSDVCIEGTWSCDGVSLTCSDTTGDDIEGPPGDATCDDSQDNDCDGDEDMDDSDCCGWAYRKVITIDAARVAGSGGSLTNFPVLVSLIDDSDLSAHVADAGGDDFAFRAQTALCTTGGLCDLDYELEEWDDASGTLTAWVRVPQLSQDTDTIIYLYYGNPCVTGAAEDPAGVWDSNFVAVWHLTDFDDSTANNNDGSNSGTGAAAGLTADARSFDGNNDHIEVGDHASLDVTDQLTMETWANLASNDNYKLLGKTSIGDGYLLGTSSGIYPEIWNQSGTNHSFIQGSFSANQWVHFAVTWRTNGSIIAYIDGVEIYRADAGSGDISTNNEDLDIGCAPWDHGAFVADGTLDEVRISNAERSADWLLTSVNNQRWPDKADHMTGFYSVGVEESGL